MSLTTQIAAGNLKAWHGHDEASGNLIDLHNAFDIPEFNTVARQAGLLGNASKFTRADIDYYKRVGTELHIPATGDWTMALWLDRINVTQAGMYTQIAEAGPYGPTNGNFLLDNLASGVLRLVVRADGGDKVAQISTPAWSGGWDVIFIWRDTVQGRAFMQVNNGPVFQSNTFTTVNVGNGQFALSGYAGGTGLNVPMDETSIWSSVLTSAERLEYWNNGLGVAYADVLPQVPDAPSALTATATAGTKIALGWVDNSDDETGFKVERSLDGSTGWTLIQTTAANATSYTDDSLTAGVKRFYRVAATNAEGDSAYTNTANATTHSGPVTSTFAQKFVTSTFTKKEVTSTFVQKKVLSTFTRK